MNTTRSECTLAPQTSIAPRRLLLAGSIAILAAGMGFGVRGGIFDNWGAEFGFTAVQLGAIGGAGFSGFYFGILIGGLICDKVGYAKLVALAFLLHMLSVAIAIPARGASAYTSLYWAMFVFAYANGTLESVVNPLVATLFPDKRTHYMNILHASAPGGIVLGGMIGWLLDDRMQVDWRIQLSFYLIPTVIYGSMFWGQRLPMSEASLKGIKLGEMLKDVGILGAFVICYLLALFGQNALRLPVPLAYGAAGVLLLTVAWLTRFSLGSVLLFVLVVAHALIGAVELGTDGWIQNITGNILSSEEGKFLFILTSATMFALRFCTDFIERHIGLSPVGILFVCAILACVGLQLSSGIVGFGGAVFALLIYTVGKSFFWPTMLAVAADRFPRSGAVALSIMGGVGMMSAGLIGTPGLGYAKDRFASEFLKDQDVALYEKYRAAVPSKFLFFESTNGLDGKKLAHVQADLKRFENANTTSENVDGQGVRATVLNEARTVYKASVVGDRITLKIASIIPACLAVIFLGILLYFKVRGGYRPKDF